MPPVFSCPVRALDLSPLSDRGSGTQNAPHGRNGQKWMVTMLVWFTMAGLRVLGIARTGVTTSAAASRKPAERHHALQGGGVVGTAQRLRKLPRPWFVERVTPVFALYPATAKPPSGSDAMSRDTASVRARWVNACGNCRGAGLSWCRSHRHRAAAARRTTAASGTGRAHARFRDHGQCGDQPEGADGERSLFASNPVSVPSTRSTGPGGTVGFTLAEFSGGRVGFSGAEFVGSAFDFSDMLPPGPSVKAVRHRRTAGWGLGSRPRGGQ